MNPETRTSFDCINFDQAFKDSLTFISEVCEVPFAFITHRDASDALIITKMGFGSLAISEEILMYNQDVFRHNTVITGIDLSTGTKHEVNKTNLGRSDFNFFVGLPIVNVQNLAIGSICVVDFKAKELSISQFKSLEYAAQQISFKLEAFEQNKVQSNKLVEKEAQLELFVDNSKEIVYEIDSDGVYSYVSKNWTTFLGHEIEEALGKNIALFIHPEDLEMCVAHLNTIVTTCNFEKELVYRVLHKDGHYVWHSSNLKFSEKEGKQVIIGSCRDITNYVEAKQKLIQQKEFYEKILDQMPTDVAVFDQDHKYVYLNKGAISDDKLRNFIIGKDDFEYAKHTGRDNTVAKIRRAKFLETLESKNLMQWEEVMISPFTGLTSYHNRKLKPVFDKNEAFEMMVGFAVDITESKKIQEEILRSKQLLRSIIENIAVGIVIQGPQSEILENNQAACEMLGLSRDQLIGKTSFDEHWKVIHVDGSEFLPEEHPVPKAIQLLQPVKNVIMGVYRPISSDLVWLLVDAIPVLDNLGTLLHVVCSFNDITNLKKIEEELKLSNERFTYAGQATSDAVWDWDMITNEIAVGSSYTDIFGHEVKNNIILYSEWGSLVHPEDRERCSRNYNDVREDKTLTKWTEEYRFLKGDGTYAYVNDKAIIIRDDNGKAMRMIGAMQDVTARKKLEDELKISNERFIYASQATSDAIWDWNIITDEITIGPKHSEIFGHDVKKNAYFNSEWERFIHPDDREKFVIHSNTAIENKTINKWSDKYRYLKADGTYAYVSDKAIIIRDDEGKAIRMIGAVRDITYNKKLEDELRQSEAQFKGAFEHSPVGMALVDIEGKYVEVNERLCEIFGYSNQELKSLTFQELTYHEDLEIDLAYKKNLDLGKISHFSSEKRFVTKSKAIIWTYISVSIEKNNKNEMYYIVQIIDITERKKIEQYNRLLVEENNKNRTIQLNEAKNMYRFLAENSVDLVCLHNLDTSFRYVSPSVINILGYTPEEMYGKSPLDYVHPEDLQYLQDNFTGYMDGKVHQTIITRFINKQEKYVWLETKANIIKERNVTTGFQSSSRDVTKRKEEEKLIEQTLAKERELNELRSNLVSTVSHEFRTPMTTIRTSAELIAIYLEGHIFEKKPRLEKQLNTITDEIDRIVDLMNSVLTISKDDAGKTNFNPIQLDLKQLCLNVIETSFANQLYGCTVKTYFEGDNFLVYADINLMKYSIFNVLNNAFKYSRGSSNVVLKLSASASTVKVQIIDQGIGIPAEDQQKLFNTFFRASNTDGIQGTGLGLYIVKTFTERNSGTVNLESVLGKGTTLTLEFPLQKT